MLRNLSKYTCKSNIKNVFFCTLVNNENNRMPNKYETVFTFPFIKYIAIFNRLKLYHCVAAGVVMPSCGVLEMLQVFSENTFFTAAYLGKPNNIIYNNICNKYQTAYFIMVLNVV